MKRVLRVGVALILLFACVSGGFYLYSKWFGLPLPFQGASRKSGPAGPAETPEALPAPDLSGTALSHGEVVATLSGVKRTVKIKPADDLSWEDAHRLMDLYNNDAVRTFDGSTAEISFGENDIVEVEENSLVIIKPRSSGAAGAEFSLA